MGRYVVYILCLGALMVPKIVMASDPLAEGKEEYKEKCVVCHGIKGDGQGPARSAFNPPPTDFTQPSFWGQQDINQFIATTIKNGHGPMPAFDLPDEEIQAITTYMSHTFRPESK